MVYRYWYCWWIDLPNLYSIELGDYAFHDSYLTIITSIDWFDWLVNRSSTIEFDQTWWRCTWRRRCFLLFIENGK